MEGVAFIVGFNAAVLAGAALFAWLGENWHDRRDAEIYGGISASVFAEMGVDEDGDPVFIMLPEDNPDYTPDPTLGENEGLTTWGVVEYDRDESGEVKRNGDYKPMYRIRREAKVDKAPPAAQEVEFEVS